jgi:hypothetical protein
MRMKKAIILSFIIIAITFPLYSLDAEKAKKAFAEGEYIPALMDYGFTEQQIKSWRITASYLRSYFRQNSGYTNPTIIITSIKNSCIQLGEITKKDMVKIEQFLQDMYSFSVNEQRQKEEDLHKKKQAEEERKTQEREQYKREQVQYAQTFGLIDFVEGIWETIMEITSSNFELAKKVMIVPNEFDQLYSVQNIVNGYVIYSAVLHGKVHQVALVQENGKVYIANSQIDIDSVYKIEGTIRFNRVLGGNADIVVISRLGAIR